MNREPITVRVTIRDTLPAVWARFTNPADIMQWNSASSDWHCPEAENDLRVGGRFRYRMAARDGSAAFDFEGTYTEVIPNKQIAFALGDARTVRVTFADGGDTVSVTETFDPEAFNPRELQQEGWQAILSRFAQHCEQNAHRPM